MKHRPPQIRYKLYFKFGNNLYFARRYAVSEELAITMVEEQCRIANLAHKKKKAFEMVQVDLLGGSLNL